MPISALPRSTVRLLGSSASIISPLSLVKELVDNGIDAEATAIEVTISANTVDKVQVRDNGTGINVDDFDSLGRRAHTSKLRSFDELRTKGGKTLGFRGEALASANALSTIRITTKTVRDPVATQLLLKFGRGGVEKRQPSSASTGTTVQALKLFENLPVRKQNAIKDSQKSLTKIKELLQGYALALPHLRLSLKVTGALGHNWAYSPRPSSETQEAILQAFGSSLLAQCTQVTKTSHSQTSLRSETEVTLVGYLPKAGCDPGLVRDRGAFVSVDTRPISTTQGTGKKIVSILKTHLSRHLAKSGSGGSPSKPFMQLSIKCSAGSYDPNVTPMKDEVLFLDERRVLDCLETLCTEIYGGTEPGTTDSVRSDLAPDLGFEQSTSPTHQLSGPRTGLNGTAEQESPLDDFQIDDDDLLEILENASCQIMQGSRGASALKIYRNCPGARHEAPPLPSTTQTVQQEGKAVSYGQDPIEAMMRTISKVDLSRKDSNGSDQDGTTGLLQVQIAPWRKTTPGANELHTRVRPGEFAPIRRFEDIGVYFQPRREQPIEIALDETATSGNTPDPEESMSCRSTRQQNIGRQPLREMTDADLNQLWEEDPNDGLASSSPEREILRPLNAPRGDLDAPRTRRGISVLGEDEEVVVQGHRDGGLSPLSSPLMVRSPRQNAAGGVQIMTSQGEGRVALQTPPSSDPASRLNPPFQPPVRHVAARGQQTSPRRITRALTRSTGLDSDGMRQTTLSFGRNPVDASNRRGSLASQAGNGSPGVRNALVSGRQEAVLRLKDEARDPEPQDRGEDGFMQVAFQYPGFFGSNPEPNDMRGSHCTPQWTHTAQALLMRTPAPPMASLEDESMRGVRCESVLPRQEEMGDVPQIMRRTRSKTGSSTKIEELRQQSGSRKNQRKNQRKKSSGKNLPLEAMNLGEETACLAAELSLQIHQLREVINNHIDVGLSENICTNGVGLGQTFKFGNMAEVEEIEDKVKGVIGKWSTEKGWEVEYSVRAGAKGKSRVCGDYD